MSSRVALFSLLASVVSAQQVGTLTAEVHPPLTWQQCTASGCTTVNGKVVLDSNWRWLHSTSGSTNCYTGNTFDATLCPNNVACAANCALDGADYASTYGITTSGNALRLNFVTKGANTNVGSRVYLMNAADTAYQTFDTRNGEFTFDVDVSHLPCGLNGALYMVPMAKDGQASSTNKAGAKYGTGYCDAQCPRDLKFISGAANVEGWTPASNSANSGTGQYGSCCAEMDIWEANSISTAYTPHSDTLTTQSKCNGDACGGTYSSDRYGGTSDPDGCDFNSYRMGDKEFYGPGKTVNTNSKFTVVTQFLTDTGTATGTINEIKRFYVQNGVVIPNSVSRISGVTGNSITTNFCNAQKVAFGDSNGYIQKGGFTSMTKAFQAGMVLVLSLWDDYAANMLWLDSSYPVESDPSKPGIARGTCPTTSGDPKDVEANAGDSYVIYSNIKVGPINSTYTGTPSTGGGTGGGSTTIRTSTTSTRSSTAGTSPTSGTGAAHYAQCGGTGYSGVTTCVSPFTCQVINPYYSQCL
ncbi:glycosyl hydrolase family 7 [Phlyctema vagabunda]|uniref:Glucanase n=1 Tax=Phlyctema vagabunda TaxID=108571 RepID=A0ABR4PBJ6_9HELO